MLVIDDIDYYCDEFAYDGCHKIYLLSRAHAEERREAIEAGYEILPVSELKETYKNSCALRFMSTWNLLCKPVPQFDMLDDGYYPKIEVR